MFHDLELLRYGLHCAIERLLSFPTGTNKVYCYCCYGTFLTNTMQLPSVLWPLLFQSNVLTSMYVYVCMHACAFVYMCVCTSACMHACVCVHVAASSSFQQHTRLKPYLSLGADNPALLGRHSSMRFRWVPWGCCTTLPSSSGGICNRNGIHLPADFFFLNIFLYSRLHNRTDRKDWMGKDGVGRDVPE